MLVNRNDSVLAKHWLVVCVSSVAVDAVALH